MVPSTTPAESLCLPWFRPPMSSTDAIVFLARHGGTASRPSTLHTGRTDIPPRGQEHGVRDPIVCVWNDTRHMGSC